MQRKNTYARKRYIEKINFNLTFKQASRFVEIIKGIRLRTTANDFTRWIQYAKYITFFH